MVATSQKVYHGAAAAIDLLTNTGGRPAIPSASLWSGGYPARVGSWFKAPFYWHVVFPEAGRHRQANECSLPGAITPEILSARGIAAECRQEGPKDAKIFRETVPTRMVRGREGNWLGPNKGDVIRD